MANESAANDFAHEKGLPNEEIINRYTVWAQGAKYDQVGFYLFYDECPTLSLYLFVRSTNKEKNVNILLLTLTLI